MISFSDSATLWILLFGIFAVLRIIFCLEWAREGIHRAAAWRRLHPLGGPFKYK